MQHADLIIDLFEGARGGQDILRIVARVVDDAADLRRGGGGCTDRGHGRSGEQGGEQRAVDHIFHGIRSEEHTSELQSLMRISYAVFCLKQKNTKSTKKHNKHTTHMKKYIK